MSRFVVFVFSPFSTWVPSWFGWNLKSFHHFVCLVLSFFQIYNSNYYWALCPKKKRPLICQWLGPGFSILFMATFIRSDISNFVGYRGDQGDCHFYESASPFYDPPSFHAKIYLLWRRRKHHFQIQRQKHQRMNAIKHQNHKFWGPNFKLLDRQYFFKIIKSIGKTISLEIYFKRRSIVLCTS